MQKVALDIAHESHQRLVKSKQYLITSVYWYAMVSDVEKCIENCLACQTVATPKRAPPIVP